MCKICRFCKKILPNLDDFHFMKTTDNCYSISKSSESIVYSAAFGQHDYLDAFFSIHIFDNAKKAQDSFYKDKPKYLKTCGLKCYQELEVNYKNIDKSKPYKDDDVSDLISEVCQKWKSIKSPKYCSVYNENITKSINCNVVFLYNEFIIVSTTCWVYTILFAHLIYTRLQKESALKQFKVNHIIPDFDDSPYHHIELNMVKTELRACSVCNRKPRSILEKWKLCARCKKTVYCSTNCQTCDWPTHKHVCKKY